MPWSVAHETDSFLFVAWSDDVLVFLCPGWGDGTWNQEGQVEVLHLLGQQWMLSQQWVPDGLYSLEAGQNLF